MSYSDYFNFEIIKSSAQSNARAGLFSTPHGLIETPIFMPVGTNSAVKMMTFDQVKATGAQIILANSYHMYLRAGTELVKSAGGLHGWMNWDKPILTDSGGFQVFSLAKLRDIHEEGVYFKHHKSGKKLFLSPELAIKVQNSLGSDIMMSFDECPPYPCTYEYMKKSVDRTLRWAKRCKEAHNNERQSLFGIVQGGEFEDLRKYSAIETVKMDFDGYSIGGTSVGEGKDVMYKMVEYSTKYLPEEDREKLKKGIGIVGKENLSALLEDYE